MLRRLTAKQFLDWERYDLIEPFGEVRADWRAASIVAMIANVNRPSKQPAYPMADFLLKFIEEAKRTQTPEEQLAIAKMIAASYSVHDKDM